jgi:chromosome segregation ATPase
MEQTPNPNTAPDAIGSTSSSPEKGADALRSKIEHAEKRNARISERLTALAGSQRETAEKLRETRADLTRQRRILAAIRWEKIKADQAANRATLTAIEARIDKARADLLAIAVRPKAHDL